MLRSNNVIDVFGADYADGKCYEVEEAECVVDRFSGTMDCTGIGVTNQCKSVGGASGRHVCKTYKQVNVSKWSATYGGADEFCSSLR